MDYLLIFHANLNYGLLSPAQVPFLCEHSYLPLFDFFNQKKTGAAWTFELSGYTLDMLCRLYPETREKIRQAFANGAEGAASPYAHSILPLFPEFHAEKALGFSMASWQRHVDYTPQVGWIPECAWSEHLPALYASFGLKTVVADFDSVVRTSLKRAGTYDSNTGVLDERLHLAMSTHAGVKAVMRTDQLDLPVLKYLHGELAFDEIKKIIRSFSTEKGYLAVYACDMEYLGTTAWYYLEKEGEHAIFQPCPKSFDRLDRLVDFLGTEGELITVTEAANRHPAPEGMYLDIENGLAWHNGTISQWESTPQARYLNTQCKFVGEKLFHAQNRRGVNQDRLDQGWWNLLLAESSDNGYPMPPHKPGEANFKFGLDHFEEAQQIADQLTADNLPLVRTDKL